jgi:hypothetical protein
MEAIGARQQCPPNQRQSRLLAAISPNATISGKKCCRNKQVTHASRTWHFRHAHTAAKNTPLKADASAGETHAQIDPPHTRVRPYDASHLRLGICNK